MLSIEDSSQWLELTLWRIMTSVSVLTDSTCWNLFWIKVSLYQFHLFSDVWWLWLGLALATYFWFVQLMRLLWKYLNVGNQSGLAIQACLHSYWAQMKVFRHRAAAFDDEMLSFSVKVIIVMIISNFVLKHECSFHEKKSNSKPCCLDLPMVISVNNADLCDCHCCELMSVWNHLLVSWCHCFCLHGSSKHQFMLSVWGHVCEVTALIVCVFRVCIAS